MAYAETKLPIGDILWQGIQLPYRHSNLIFRFSLPLIALLVFTFLFAEWGSSLEDNEGSGVLALVLIALIIAIFMTVTLAVIACHRIFILGESSMKGFKLISWTPREWRFIAWWIVIGLIASVVFLPIQVLLLSTLAQADGEMNVTTAVALYIGQIPAMYVFSRLALVLPATAVDKRPNLRWAWTVSKGNGLRLLVIIGLIPLMTDLIFQILAAARNLAISGSTVYSVISMVIGLYIVVVEIALLSLSYKALRKNETIDSGFSIDR